MAAWRANTQKSAKPKDSEPKAESSAAKRRSTARPRSSPVITKSRPNKRQDILKPMRSKSGITLSRPSKRQGISKPKRRTKGAERRSESNDTPATTSRFQSLRQNREHRRVKSGGSPLNLKTSSGLTRAFHNSFIPTSEDAGLEANDPFLAFFGGNSQVLERVETELHRHWMSSILWG